MTVQEVRTESPGGLKRPAHVDPQTQQVLDWAMTIQDDLLDETYVWVSELPLDESAKTEIFEHVCVVTGKMVDRLLHPV